MHLKKILGFSLAAALALSSTPVYGAVTYAHERVVKEDDGKYYGYDKKGKKLKGWHVVGNKLYYFNGKNNAAITNKTVRSVRLLKNGVAASTLDAVLCMKVTKILQNQGVANATKGRKLRVLWNYLTSRRHFGYYSKYPNLSSASWAKDYANWMLDHRRGNCYGFACTFAAMAYAIGYNPTLVAGRVHGSRDRARDGYTRHCAVKINGRWYDPEAQCAGWMRGVYGSRYYRTSFIGKNYYSYAHQNGNKKAIVVANKGQYYYYQANGYYYGFDSNNKPLTGYYFINEKLFCFDGNHRMKVTDSKSLQELIKYKTPFAALATKLGTAVNVKNTGEGCSGIAGSEVIYKYDHLIVNTIIPSDGSGEIILSIMGK